MRGSSACAIRRSLRSSNLLPNVYPSIVCNPSVLRLVVSVAKSWGKLRRLRAWMSRLDEGLPAPRATALRTSLSQCLDGVMFLWSSPAPAAQVIPLSTCRLPAATQATRDVTGWGVCTHVGPLPCGPRLLKEC
jgi:hypothetical protein